MISQPNIKVFTLYFQKLSKEFEKTIFHLQHKEYKQSVGKSYYGKKEKDRSIFHSNRYKIKKYTFKKCTFFG